MDFLKKKKGYHSTQKKYFGTIPRSEFYGITLGYAIGLFISGALRLETQFQTLLFAAAGYFIGLVYDRKYCMEPDVPLEEDSGEDLEQQEALPEKEPAAEPEQQDVFL
ncbi:MAG: hypothetical protein Q4D81_05485 [Eubacteriales bacterium]|nr:hypothetical protein [Eubacteriales bacterium]